MNIKTPQDWWAALDEHWPHVCAIVYHFARSPETKQIPEVDGNFGPDDVVFGVKVVPVSVGFDTLGFDEAQPEGIKLGTWCEQLKRDWDHRPLINVLNKAWALAPDAPWIHEMPGWDILCDLCSEGWVFDLEDMPQVYNAEDEEFFGSGLSILDTFEKKDGI